MIRPFDRAWVPAGFCLAGFVLSMDGGKVAFGDTIHCLSENKASLNDQSNELHRALCICRSKISKRNIVAHECLSARLGVETLELLLEPTGS